MRTRVLFAVVFCGLIGSVAIWGAPPLVQGQEKGKPKKPAPELPKELVPRRMTLQGKEITVKQALAELAKQTGNVVEDRRQVPGDTPIKLDLKDATFWQALDAIAKAGDLKISFGERDARVALVDGPYLALPVSYNGLFRVMIARLDLYHVLETDTHLLNLYLDVAWEPRFQPLLIEAQPEAMELQDDKGRSIEISEESKGRAAIGSKASTQMQVRVPAPQRSAARIGVFKGKLSVLGPTKMLTFTFDKLAKIDKKSGPRKETQDGVTVSLRELRNEGQGDDQIWTAGVLLDYPADGPKFESFQSWLVNNEIYLDKEKDGIKQRFPPNLGYETDDQTDNKAFIRYRFGDEPDKNLILGNISDWKLIYRTPGRIAEVPIPFEFRDVPLP